MKYLGAPQSGSQANTTASKNRAGQYYRNRRSPVQPIGTGRRALVRTNFGNASKFYGSLTASQQAAWAAYALTTPYVDSLGQSIILTGHQMCVAINSQLQNCGQPTNPVPPVSGAVAAITPAVVSFADDGTVLLTLPGAGSPSDFQLVAFSGPQSGGKGFVNTFWQASVRAGDENTAIDLSEVYDAQFGLPPVGGRVFFRLTAVNQYGISGVPSRTFTTVVSGGTPAVVTAGLAGIIHWTHSGTAPAFWQVFTSADGGATWDWAQSVTGVTLTATGLPSGVLARVIGTDATGTIVVGRSNSVTVV